MSDVGLLRKDERVVTFDAEVADCALQLRVAQQELASSQIASPLVDQGNLGPTQAVGTIKGRVQPYQCHPVVE